MVALLPPPARLLALAAPVASWACPAKDKTTPALRRASTATRRECTTAAAAIVLITTRDTAAAAAVEENTGLDSTAADLVVALVVAMVVAVVMAMAVAMATIPASMAAAAAVVVVVEDLLPPPARLLDGDTGRTCMNHTLLSTSQPSKRALVKLHCAPTGFLTLSWGFSLLFLFDAFRFFGN